MNRLEKDLEKDNSVSLETDISKSQESFLESSLGKTINIALDIGLKAALPDLIEDQIINIKNTIFENGFNEGIKEAIDSAVNLGKSAIGIFTGNFENVSQIDLAVKKGGLLDKTSELLDASINFAKKSNLINKDVSSILKTSKNSIISTISKNIENEFSEQIKNVEKIDKYCLKWQEAYKEKDISKMNSYLNNIEKNLEKTVPLENVLNRARAIQTIHNLMKKNNNFELSEEAFELAQKIN